MEARPTPLEIIKNMRNKNFREEIILEEVEKELIRLQPLSPQSSVGAEEILELNATNSGLRYAASELQFRIDKQNEHIAILIEEAKKKDERIKELEDGLYGLINLIETIRDDAEEWATYRKAKQLI